MPIESRSHLSDSALVRAALRRVRDEARLTAEHLADLAEIDGRKAWRAEAFSSLLDFCVRGLHLTRDEAKLRIRLARLARRIPLVFGAIADGRLRLTAVDLLASRLTEDNAAALIAEASGRTIEELRELLAAHFPQPDVAERIVCLGGAGAQVQTVSGEGGSNPLLTPERSEDLAPGAPLDTFALSSPTTEVPEPRTKVEPLSAGSFGLHCTIPRGTYEKLEYVKALLGRGGASGELAQVLDRALDALARELERRKYGIVDHPRPGPTRRSANPRHVPAAVKRAVVARDAGRCTFVSESGRRCEARERLEFDHALPVARGGEASAGNLRLRCRAHNQLEAEREFGAEFMQGRRAAARDAVERRRRGREAHAAAPPAVEAAPRGAAIEEIIPWLRALELGKEEARRAAEVACRDLPDAPLEARVRWALGSLARSRPVAPFAIAGAAG